MDSARTLLRICWDTGGEQGGGGGRGGRWDSAGTAQGIFWDPAGTMLWRTLPVTRSLAPCMQSSPVCKDSDTDKTITTGTCLGPCCGERCQLLPALLFACNPIQLLSGSRARPGLKARAPQMVQKWSQNAPCFASRFLVPFWSDFGTQNGPKWFPKWSQNARCFASRFLVPFLWSRDLININF